MASVIVDNSTITAVQRLLGQAPAPRSYDAQGDYSALENFFAHLIFYDDIYHIDDYKAEFRESRSKAFPFIRTITHRDLPYVEIEKASITLTRDLVLDIRGGKQSDGLLKELLEAMSLHVTCAWHMRSSEFFLTLKILANEPDDWDSRYKYSPLTAMIFDQLTGMGPDGVVPPVLLGSDGKVITTDVDADLLTFSNSLNWLARRAAFYSMASAAFDAGVCLHPIRHHFLSRWSAESGLFQTTSHQWRTQIANFFAGKASQAINAINASTEPLAIGLRLPLFAAWAVGAKGNVKDAMSFISEIGQEPNIVALRKNLRELDGIRSCGDTAAFKRRVNELQSYIDSECSTLVGKYGGTLNSVPSVMVQASLVPVPSLSVATEFKLASLWSGAGRRGSVRALVRNVVTDIIGFDSLGAVRSALLGNVQRSNNSMPTLRIEERRFFGKTSDWKKPM